MRILVLTNMYPPHHYGGYELNCEEIVTAFRAAGHDVLVLTSDVRVPGVEEPAEPRDDVRRDLRLYWHDHEILRPSLRECLRIERANQRALASALADLEPDVVSAWHMGAMSMHLLTTVHRHGTPMVCVIEDDWLVYGPLVDRWTRTWRRPSRVPGWAALAHLADRALGVPCRLPDLGRVSTYCFMSTTLLRTAEREGGWDFADATVVYGGVNTDDFPIVETVASGDWSWRLLHVGRVDDRKGIDTAVRALARLPAQATLEVLGRGDERHLAYLRRLARELEVEERVHFDVADRRGLAARYAAADAVLFVPKWEEPFGLVPLEAMACATPVVTTATGGSGEYLIDEGNCLRVGVDDDEQLAQALHRLAGDPTLRARLVAGGIATASELTGSRWAGLLERWHTATATGDGQERPTDREPIEQVLARRVAIDG